MPIGSIFRLRFNSGYRRISTKLRNYSQLKKLNPLSKKEREMGLKRSQRMTDQSLKAQLKHLSKTAFISSSLT
jgi:hypothetical protein